MARTSDDDLDLLAIRLRLGIPLEGFDGRPIPLRHPDGREVDPMEAAQALLESGAEALGADGDDYIEYAIWRARSVEAEAIVAGQPSTVAEAKATAVLVSAAIRASVLARSSLASPTELNRATLAWYEVHDERLRRILGAAEAVETARLSA